MKNRITLVLVAAMAAALTLSGCDPSGGSESDASHVFDGIRVKTSSGTTWYNLYIDLEDPDNPLSAGGNTDWDIEVSAAKEILTNSGVTATAESSGGAGGVVFSGYTDFDTEISAAAAQTLFAAAGSGASDYSYWDMYHSTSTAAEQTGNAVSFPGYSTAGGRDGVDSDTAWIWDTDLDFSLGDAYCRWDRMTPNFRDYTYNVYIVRSGDGSSYYKMQIAEASYLKETDTPTSGSTTYHYTYKVKIEKLQ